MYWVPKIAAQPLNGQDVVVWSQWEPEAYTVCRYYDEETLMDDGTPAPAAGFYVRSKSGRRFRLRSGVSWYLPLETPRPTEETRARQFRRGYKAALLRLMVWMEDRSCFAAGGEAWLLKELHSFAEEEFRKITKDAKEKTNDEN